MAKEDIILRINPVMETGDIRSAVKDIEKYFGNMNLSKEMSGEFKGIFDKLLKEVDNFETKAQSSFKKASDVSALEKSANKIDNLFGNLIKSMGKLDTLDLEDLVEMDTTQIKKFTEEIDKLKKELEQLTKQNFSVSFDSFKGISKSGEIKNFFDSLKAGNVEGMSSALKGLQQNVLAFTSSIQIASNQSTNAAKAFEKYSRALQSGDFNTINSALKELKTTLEGVGNIKGSNLIQFIGLVERIGDEFQEGQRNINDFGTRISQLEDEKLRQMAIELEKMAQSAKENQNAITGMANSVHNYTSATTSAAHQTNQLNTELDEIKNRVKYFFSLESAVDLFRRGIQQAYETVKELDKVMTETAVVTNFSVGDMWDQLPQYSKMAKELGVSIQGVYEASTLYYQQGLKQEEVMALTEETLKMARIAGLDYAEATDLMTAALRGFNMEINQTSAQNVNDIYSKLAAITAADTEEIATAMTKTASIANSANMELETTAALLAQMIETTREPAETAGTAMKTIIARFTEMKNATSDIINVDGEEVNVNKVEAALKSAGVALRDSTGQFRELDDVFLDLSKRWDSLDVMTQRYIATTAAGSRQQSRFIAMMQDYDRTMELVDAAYNSSGASSAQFMKTQESLETKINNLKSAWQEFTMGLANSDAIKTVIDLITKLLETINSASESTNGFSSFMSKMFIAFTAFKIGKGIFNKMFSGVGAQLSKLGMEAGQQAGKGLKTGIEQSASQGLKQSAKKAWDSFSSFFRTKETMLAIPISIEFDENGKTSMQNFENELKKLFKINPAEFTNQIDNIGSTLENSIVAQLEQHGLSDNGRDWAHELVKGAMERLKKSPAELSAILADLKNQVFAGLNDDKFSGNAGASERAEKDILENGLQVFDKALPKIEKTRANIEGIGTALASAAMTTDLIVGGLEDIGAVSEDTANTIKNITSGLSTAGTSMMALKAASDMFNISANLNPYIAIISVIIAGISMVGNAIKQNAEEEKKLNEQRIQNAKDSAEKTKQINDDTAAYQDMIDVYEETGEATEELKQRKEELIETYDLEKYGVDSLTSSYEEVAEAMKKARLEQLKTDRASQQTGLSSSTNLAYTEGKKATFGGAGWTDSDSFEVDLGYDTNYDLLKQTFERIAAEEGLTGLSFSENGNQNLQIDGLPNTPEGKQQWMRIISKVIEEYSQIDPNSTGITSLSDFWGVVSSHYITGEETTSQAKTTEKDLARETALATLEEREIKTIEDFERALNDAKNALSDFDLTDDEKRNIAMAAVTETSPEAKKAADVYTQLSKMKGATEDEIFAFMEELSYREFDWIANLKVVIDEDSTIEQVQEALSKEHFTYSLFGDVDFLQKATSISEKIAAGEMTDKDYATFYKELADIPGFYGGMDAQSYWASIKDADKATQLGFISKVSQEKNRVAQQYRDSLIDKINLIGYTQTSDKYNDYNAAKKAYEEGQAWITENGTSKDINTMRTNMNAYFDEGEDMVYWGKRYEDATGTAEDLQAKRDTARENAITLNPANLITYGITKATTEGDLTEAKEEASYAAEQYNDSFQDLEDAAKEMQKVKDEVKLEVEYDGETWDFEKIYGLGIDDEGHWNADELDKYADTAAGDGKLQGAIDKYLGDQYDTAVKHEENIRDYEEDYLNNGELTYQAKIYDSGINLFTDDEIQSDITKEQQVERLLQYNDLLNKAANIQTAQRIFGEGGTIQQLEELSVPINFENLDETIAYINENVANKALITEDGERVNSNDIFISDLEKIKEIKDEFEQQGIEIDWSNSETVLQQLQEEYEKLETEWVVDDTDLEDAANKLEALEELTEDIEEIKISIDMAKVETAIGLLDQLALEMDNINAAASLIEPVTYQVDPEGFSQIMQMAPELLENHKNLKNGMIQLDQEVVNSYISGQQKTLEADAQLQIQRLEQEKIANNRENEHLQKVLLGQEKLTMESASHIVQTKIDQANDEMTLSNESANESVKASGEMATGVITNYEQVSGVIDILGIQANNLADAIRMEGEYIPRDPNAIGAYLGKVVTGTMTEEERELKDWEKDATEYMDHYDLDIVTKGQERFQKWLETSEFSGAEAGSKEYQEALDEWWSIVESGEEYKDNYVGNKRAYDLMSSVNTQIIVNNDENNQYSLQQAEWYRSYTQGDQVLENLKYGDSDLSEAVKENLTEAGQENFNKQLAAIDRIQETLDREASLIEKLPEEIAAPLKLINMGENLVQEIKKDEVERNKLEALRGQREILESESQYLGQYYYYDEGLEEYLYNVDAVNQLKGEERDKVEEEIQALDELNQKIHEAEDAVDGGKVQKIFHELGKGVAELGEKIKHTPDIQDLVYDAIRGEKKELFNPFAYLASALLTEPISFLNNLNTPGLIRDEEKAREVILKIEESEIGQKLGSNAKDLISQIIGGGNTYGIAGSLVGTIGEGLSGLGDFLTFDIMEQGLDMANQAKDIIEKAVQTVIGYVQTLVNWWINREDWLYNLLTSIEKEVQNFSHQENVEDRVRAYSNEGYDEIMDAWQAMQDSLDEQFRLNEQLIQSRQAELMGLNLSNILFYPAFHYDRKEEKVVENPWVYNIYTLILELASKLPLIGEFFPIIKSLMEDNKKRMEEIDGEITDARDRLEELELEQLENDTKYMEDQIELEKLVMDSIIEKQQEEIDKLSLLNDAITDANAKLIETLNSNLEKIRQQRENGKKEEELGEKERRLAYLRQDTSGANRQEIKKLEEELEDERRDYTDTLIDQRISDLEEQNDKAAEQRQKQIDLLQSQLDYTQRYGLQWEEAQQLIKNGFDSEGRLKVGTDLYNMLMAKEDITSLGMESASEWEALQQQYLTGLFASAYRDRNNVWERGIFSPLVNGEYDKEAQGYYNGESFWEDLIKSIRTFFGTGFLSGDESTSWLGKTIIPQIQQLFSINKANNTVTQAEGVTQATVGESIEETGNRLGNSFLSKLETSFSDMGKSITDGFNNLMNNKNSENKTTTQTVGDINMEFHINSEDGESGMNIAESIVSAFKQGISNLSIFK